jgi:transcriptional regulator with XRE-family HTH domain
MRSGDRVIPMSIDSLSGQVGSRVREALKTAKMPQRVLADQLQLTQPAVFRRLAGKVEFSIRELILAAELLDVPLADLLPSPVLAEPETAEATA